MDVHPLSGGRIAGAVLMVAGLRSSGNLRASFDVTIRAPGACRSR
ncbi:MAG: hypothetical protein WBD71_06965 [Xanthobacteraceae bacterium]